MAAAGQPRLRAVLFDAGDTLIHMPRRREEILIELCRHFGEVVSPESAAEACLRSERFYLRHYLSFRGDQGEFWRRYHGVACATWESRTPPVRRPIFYPRIRTGRDMAALPEAAGFAAV